MVEIYFLVSCNDLIIASLKSGSAISDSGSPNGDILDCSISAMVGPVCVFQPCHIGAGMLESGAKALSSKMTPRGALRAVSEVSAQISKFSFFWAFEASKVKFRSNFAGGTHSKLSFSFSEMALI